MFQFTGAKQGDCKLMSSRNHTEIADSARLTRREVEILSLIVEGHSSKQVADILFVSKRTVDFHLDNVYEKLQVSNRMQALQRATRLGLLPRTA
jgi:ATP/maltotriose-dependent transcriptional regulator MalT